MGLESGQRIAILSENSVDQATFSCLLLECNYSCPIKLSTVENRTEKINRSECYRVFICKLFLC